MSVSCGDVCVIMEKIAPEKLAESWDNVGLLIGRKDAPVTKILAALDVTDAVIDEAVRTGAEMIVAHHPVIFTPVAAINGETALGCRLLKIIENKINIFAAHTNLDVADGGTSDAFAELLALENTEKIILDEKGVNHIGRAGLLKKPARLRDFADFVRQKLGMDSIRCYGDEARVIRKVGICPGSGAEYGFIQAARDAGCDVYVTADIGYHKAQDAVYGGLCMIDATHFASEAIVVPRLCEYLSELGARGVRVTRSASETQIFTNVTGRYPYNE